MYAHIFLWIVVTSSLSFTALAETPQHKNAYDHFTESLAKKQNADAYQHALHYLKLGGGDMTFRIHAFLGLCWMENLGCTQNKMDTQKAVQYLETAHQLKPDDPHVTFLLYLAYDKANFNKKAFEALNAAAKLGHARAMLVLANCFEVGVPPAAFDPLQARNWLQRWQSLNNRDIDFDSQVKENIERLNTKIANMEAATKQLDIDELEKQGHTGNSIAINKLITIYVTGNDQQGSDPPKAKFWADVRAAYSPDSKPYNFIELAQDYQTGRGTSRNLAQARFWYAKASSTHDNRARLALAQMDKDAGDNNSAHRLFKEICDNDKSIQYACLQTSYFYIVKGDINQSLVYAERSGDQDFINIVSKAKLASETVPTFAYSVQYVTDWTNDHNRTYALTCGNGQNMGKFVIEFSNNSSNPYGAMRDITFFKTFDEAARYECRE